MDSGYQLISEFWASAHHTEEWCSGHLQSPGCLPIITAKKPVTTMLTYPWKCTVLHCNHLGNTWKPLVLMTRHFDYCPSASEGDNQSVRSSAPVVSRCFPGGYNVKLYISRGRLAWWLLAFLCCECTWCWCLMPDSVVCKHIIEYGYTSQRMSLLIPGIIKQRTTQNSFCFILFYRCWILCLKRSVRLC